MAKPYRTHALRNLESAANSTLRTADKAASGLFRWATTDHTGMSSALASMPKMGFLDSLGFIFRQFLIAVAGAILTGVLAFLLIGAIQFLLFGHL